MQRTIWRTDMGSLTGGSGSGRGQDCIPVRETGLSCAASHPGVRGSGLCVPSFGLQCLPPLPDVQAAASHAGLSLLRRFRAEVVSPAILCRPRTRCAGTCASVPRMPGSCRRGRGRAVRSCAVRGLPCRPLALQRLGLRAACTAAVGHSGDLHLEGRGVKFRSP